MCLITLDPLMFQVPPTPLEHQDGGSHLQESNLQTKMNSFGGPGTCAVMVATIFQVTLCLYREHFCTVFYWHKVYKKEEAIV